MKHVDIAIIGAGTAGLSALRSISQTTDNYCLIDKGPLGTTCARNGCIPSKALIHLANTIHQQDELLEQGLVSTTIQPDQKMILKKVRETRDYFAANMVATTKKLAGDRFIEGEATLLSPNTISVNDEKIKVDKIIIATGADPVIPFNIEHIHDSILTTDSIFEQEQLPSRMAVIGLGPVGLELGQALNRLGVHVVAFDLSLTIGGLSDPIINAAAVQHIEKEFPLILGSKIDIDKSGGELVVHTKSDRAVVDKILVATGVTPNLDRLGIENLGVELDDKNMPSINPATGQIAELPIYIAGDANKINPIQHEAVDEGWNSAHEISEEPQGKLRQRTPLRITFSDPQIAVVGKSYAELNQDNIQTLNYHFYDQPRARIEGQNYGFIHIYTDNKTQQILGAEMAIPAAEHIAHLLALAIHQKMTPQQLLEIPFYHPTFEEGLKECFIAS